MGEVIALTRSQNGRAQAPASGGADIVFFTGVRYYRMTDEEFAKASAPKPPRAPKGKQAVSRRLKRHA